MEDSTSPSSPRAALRFTALELKVVRPLLVALSVQQHGQAIKEIFENMGWKSWK